MSIDPKPGELVMDRLKVELKFPRRTEPVPVTRVWDEPWLGVKGLTNSEIAGFPRNLLR